MGDQLKKLKTRNYSISKVNFIRQALAGYGGGSAIASEMTQNADDAEASRIIFHFTKQALIIRNDSVFTDKDFDSITEIAKGEKGPEADKIGTWGTGFLSVFHITDAPELRSSGEYIVFDPNVNDLDTYESDVIDSTEFRLPWRTKPTELSHRLEADTWSDQQILELKNNLANDIYRLVLFLRHVNIIEVYEGDTEPKLIARVERKPPKEYANGKFKRLQREIEYKRAGQHPRTDTWLYYVGQVPDQLCPADVAIKDTRLSIAFPLKKSEWLDQNIPAALYNFLPTPIKTGLPFQINSAFFPDNNRQSILLDRNTQREKSEWNWQVLRQLGHLFVDAILDIREQVTEPRRFYELLPVSEPRHDFLKPVQKCFFEIAATLPIVFTSLNDWRKPPEVFMGRRGSRLPELAADYLPVLPTGVPQAFRRDFLEQKQNIPTLEIKHILNYLRSELSAGRKLKTAHPMINDRNKLDSLYSELPTSGLGDAALCLAEDETLWPFTQVWRASKSARQLLAETDIRFIDIEMQKKFASRMDKLVREFKGADLVEWLAHQEWPEIGALKTDTIAYARDRLKQFGSRLSKWFQSSPTDQQEVTAPLSLSESPSFIRDAGHLAEILRFIAQDLSSVDKNLLSRLPLARTEEDYLLSPNQVYHHDEAGERVILKKLGLHFVYADWHTDTTIWSVYQQAGMKGLETDHVIEVLPEAVSKWTDRPTDEVIDDLLALYQYFNRHSRRLDNRAKDTLRKLPLCITQQGRLVPTKGGDVILHLSADASRRSTKQVLAHLDLLELDNLIHSKLLERGRKFLTDILGLDTLSSTRLIESVIIPYYNDPRLSDMARQDLLRFISEEMRRLPENRQRTLFPLLLEEPLIRCADGQYRRAKEVYFASPALDTVFINGYHTLHPDYEVEVAEPHDQDQTPYRRSIWYWLFDFVEMNETPIPVDLVQAIETVVTAGPPTEKRLEAVRRIYDLLNREAGKGDFTAESALTRLAQLAWLPARHDDTGWHRPSHLYQASHADFVGNQAPLLRFPESTVSLRRLLSMPSFPTVDIVANHLLASARENKKVDRRVYDEMGRRWNELNNPLQQRLKREAVVWGDGDKYWPTNRVFLGDYHRELFGQRRCYLKPPGGDAQKFLQYIGVKEKPDDWRDSIELLKEISDDYADGQPVSDQDLNLLYHNFNHLGHHLLSGNDKKLEGALRLLSRCKLVPAKDGYLHLPNRIVLDARQDIVEQFASDAIPVVFEDKLTENGYRFLRQLGVKPLNEYINRRPVDTTGSRKDVSFSLHLQQLIPAFQRMALTYQEQNGDTSDLPKKRLQGVELRVCPKLVVGYELDNSDGWRVMGHSRPEEALYFSDGKQLNYLYVKQIKHGEFPTVALARELERILFPNSKESPVIDVLLQKPLSEVDGYLDEHGYRRLYKDEIPEDDFEVQQPALMEWEEATETPTFDDNDAVVEDEQDDRTNSSKINNPPDPLNGNKITSIEDASPETVSQGQFDLDPPNERDDQKKPLEPDEPVTTSEAETSDSEATSVTKDKAITPQQPTTDTPPVPKGKRTSSSEKTTQPTGDSAKEANIPPFTGIRRPSVPMLPNDYGELQRKFGLERTTNGVSDSDSVDGDNEWRDPSEPEPKDGTRQVRQSRFTLTFTNRYQGFLPLHHGARQMLHDQPSQLNCQTDFEDWKFALYINYHDGIIYNQEMLPKFFEAYNIPAGGVVYLERVSHDMVRLFWKPMNSRVENIRCLELLEDGTLDEYEVPAAEFPCEVAEYVLRAEKRLEDPEALFKQALNKRGAFQTICEVFGEAGKELTYDQIFKGVMARRRVAKATIDYQLRQRPCFVDLGNERWRFEPKRGTDPIRSPEKRPKETIRQQSPQQPSPSPEPSPPPPPPSPYQIILNEAQQEWQTLSDFFNPDGHDPADRLQALAEHLSKLAQRLQTSLTTLAQPWLETDDVLAVTWQNLAKNAADQKTERDLRKYLQEKFTQGDNEPLLVQVKQLLVQTATQQCELVFFPMLSDIAYQLAESGKVTPTRQMYQMLQEHGAGNFETQLAQLKKIDEVQEYIDLAESAETESERWELWTAAWQKYPGYPTLRRAIQGDVKHRVETAEKEIESNFNKKKVDNAFERYSSLLADITPFVDAWQIDQKVAPRVWGLAQRLFEVLRNSESYRQALELVAKLPKEAQLRLDGNLYLEAIQAVAEEFENQADNLAAAVLMDYGIGFANEKCWPVGDYILTNAYEDIGRLYENLAMTHRAYDFIKQAQRKAIGGKKTLLGQRAYALNQQRDEAQKQVELQSWQTQTEALLDKSDFSRFVNPEVFRSFCSQT